MNCSICKCSIEPYTFITGEHSDMLNSKDFTKEIVNFPFPLVWEEILIEKLDRIRSEHEMLYGHDCHKCGRRKCNGLCLTKASSLGQTYGIIEHKICSIKCLARYWKIK